MNGKPKRIAIAIVSYQQRLMVGVRPPDVPLAGMSEFPGGKVEEGEEFTVAAVRECQEETGLAVRADRVLMEKYHEYPHGRLHLQFIECSVVAESQQGLPDLDGQFQWVERSRLAELEFPDANQEIVKMLLERDPT